MDPAPRFALDASLLVTWALQLALILWVWRPGGDRVGLPALSIAGGLAVVAAGWAWRLVYAFVLAAGGFRFWVGDDAVRWLRAWQWSQDPFLVFPGDPWLVGPYVLHGSWMAWIGDPTLAARLLASALCALPLLGVFALTQALFRSATLAACAAALLAPHWLHVLLGTGTMTEMPVVGLLLLGVACYVRAHEDRRQGALAWWGAGCLLLATSLHLSAWIYAVAIQLTLGLVAWRGDAAGRVQRLRRWLGPAVLSGGFCVFWLAAHWWSTGNPFTQFQAVGDTTIFRYGRPGHRLWNAHIYPSALVYALFTQLPLAAYGVIRALLPGGSPAARALLGGSALALLLLAASAGAGTNVTPFRTVLPLAAACLPLAVGAVLREGAHRLRDRRAWIGSALGALVVATQLGVHHERVFSSLELEDVAWTQPRMQLPESMDLADTFAVGTFFRREFQGYGRLAPANLSQPIRVFVGADRTYHWFEWLFLVHAMGDPGRLDFRDRGIFEEPQLGPLLRGLAPGQLLVSNRRVADRRVAQVLRIGRYWIYEGLAPRGADVR